MMVAYFEVQRVAGESKRILKVERVAGPAEAATLVQLLRARHVEKARLLSLEEEGLEYTVSEIGNERNLLGGVRRYSTGCGTVTIPGRS